jgi:hypothetical protein
MTTQKEQLIPTTIRLSATTLKMLNEASSLQQITRADLIRVSIQQTIDRWLRRDRIRVIEKLQKLNRAEGTVRSTQ